MATGKGGYDYEFVTPPPKSLECPVCLLTLRDPHVISCCGNEFCQVCIQRVQEDGKPCPLCNEPSFTTMLHKKLTREVNTLVIHCPQKEVGCGWEGELGQLQLHLNPEAGPSSITKGCDYMIVACSYQCGVHLQRQKIQEHEMEICPRRPVEMQVASLMRKVEAITVENQLLRQELNQLKQTHQYQMDEMKHTHLQELADIKKRNDYLEKGQEDMQKKQDALEEKCVSLQTHASPLPLPPFYFIMGNVNHYQKHNYMFWSEPFYSHPGGYKMLVSVYPNGFGISAGTHLTLDIFLLRGEFDDKLRWPFNGEVTVQAYNRSRKQWAREKTFIMNERECAPHVFCRQVDTMVAGHCGCQNFLSLSELGRNYVQKFDAVRFRITKVKICT